MDKVILGYKSGRVHVEHHRRNPRTHPKGVATRKHGFSLFLKLPKKISVPSDCGQQQLSSLGWLSLRFFFLQNNFLSSLHFTTRFPAAIRHTLLRPARFVVVHNRLRRLVLFPLLSPSDSEESYLFQILKTL